MTVSLNYGARWLSAFLILRRHIPSLGITWLVFLAQLVAWFIGWQGALVASGALSLFLIVARRCSTAAAGLLLGFLSVAFGSTAPESRVPLSPDMLTLVQVVEEPRRVQVGGVSFVGLPLISSPGSAAYLFTAVDLPWRNAHALERGDVAWIRASCARIPQSLNPFSFDARLHRRNITAKCKARYVSEVVDRTPSPFDVPRQKILHQARASVGDSQGLSIFLAMALGYRDLLSTQAEREFQMAGLSHLLVVSGYQVTLVFSVIFLIFARILQYMSALSEPKRFAAFPAMLLAISYVLLCGAESSTIRALIAAACVAVQVLDEHAPRYSQRCFVALLLLMLISPWCFFDLGVQLTFAALAGIGLGSRLSPTRRGLRSLWWVSVSVWLLTSVVGVISTGRLSLMAVIFNLLLAAPWSALDCTFGLLAVAVCTIGLDSNGYLLQAVVWINQKALEFVSWGAAVPHATVEFESPLLRCTVAAILICLLLLLAHRALRRSGVFLQVSPAFTER